MRPWASPSLGKLTLMHLTGGVDRPMLGSVTIDSNEIIKQNKSELCDISSHNIGPLYQF